MEILYKGIDVSVHQGIVNFNKVKQAGIDFVILRAGYGIGNVDKNFYTNYSLAKLAGLHVGAYWYSYADSVQFAEQEAKSCLDTIKGLEFEYPIFYDVEEQSQIAKGKEFYSSLLNAFCPILEQSGYFTGFYTNLNCLLTVIDAKTAKRYACWVAQWGNTCSYMGDYGMWQYSATGRISGIDTDVDMNYCYVDYPKLIKKLKLNGYQDKQKLKPIEQVTQEVLDGKWNVGEARKQELLKAGYNYDLVQAKVNELLEQRDKYYVVQAKDDIDTICTKFDITHDELVEFNNWLKVGDKIQIKR